MRDLSFALRLYRKTPGTTFLAVLCLALGIGVNTSIFSLLNSVLLRPLPVPEPGRVVMLSRGGSTLFSYPDFRDYRDRNRSLAALAASAPFESSLDREGQGRLVSAERVSSSYADAMRVRPMIGRWFAGQHEPAAVISHSAWRYLFNEDPSVLGRRVRSETQWYTVVGVAPPEFTGINAPIRTDLWVPLESWARQYPTFQAELQDRARPRVMLFGRLNPGVATSQAAAEINRIDRQLQREHSRAAGAAVLIAVEPVRGATSSRREATPVVALLMGAVGLVLLIACVNVGHLLLARGAARQREIAVRLALGASHGRLVRQLMTESVLLALWGGLAGLILGHWTNRLLEAAALSLPLGEVVALDLSPDMSVLAFTVSVSLATTLIFGLLPAWRTARATASLNRFRLRRAPLVSQIALSLVLLLSAGLFVRALLRFEDADPGFAVRNRLYAWTYVTPPEFTPQAGRQFYAQAVDRLRALPGVRNAGVTYFLPLTFPGSECVARGEQTPHRVTTGTADPGLLATLGIPLQAGRNFSGTDGPNRPRVVIVNETLARRLWPRENPVGQRLRVGCKTTAEAEVIGVARDSKVRSLTEAPQPHMYLSFAQNYTPLSMIVIETGSDPAALAETIRRALLSHKEGVRIYAVKPVGELVRQSYWLVRWEASLLAAFGALAVVLAAVGLYGAVSYQVTLRTREIGIRMAIGARPREVFRLVLRQGLAIALIGVVIGQLASLGLARLLRRFLFGLSPLDPVTYTGAALLWIVVAALACFLPARRAAGVQPVVALRYE